MSRTSNINRRFSKLQKKQVQTKLFSSFQESSKAITDLAKSISITTPLSFKETKDRMINLIGTPGMESELTSLMARQLSNNLDNEMINRFDKNGDFIVPGCETAVFRDRPSKLNGKNFDSIIIDDPLCDFKEEKPKGQRTIKSIIDKYRIDNNG